MQLRALLFACCVAWVRIGPAQAQQAPSDTSRVAFQVQMPDSVVVTASRTSSAIQETGRRVTVYTQRDIQDLAVNSVDQLLNVMGGVDVQSRGGFGVQSDLTMRGSTFTGVLLLLDGARINDPMTGHFRMDLPVPLSEIARVEVLRGPATALYGPDAIGGVVHLITKTALRAEGRGGTGLSARIDGRYGNNALHDVGAAARHGGKRTTVSAAASMQGSDGQTVRNDQGQPIPDGRGGTVQTDFDRRVGTAALSHRFDDATLYARAGVDDRDFNAWHYYTPFPSDKARESTSTVWAQSRLTSSAEAETPWRAQVAGKQHRDRYAYNANVPANRHTSRMVNAQGHVSHTLGPVRVTGGGSGQLRGIDSNRYGLHNDVSVGTFLSVRWRLTPRLTINQSTRVDYDPLYGVEPTPQLYASYRFDRVTLRAGGGRAVRAPNYLERYIDSGGNVGNPDLQAETAWSGEVGTDLRLLAGLRVHLTGFGRRTRDLIDYAKEASSAQTFVARNLHRVTTLGVETEAAFDRTVGGVGVHLDAAYTYLDASLEAQEQVAGYKYALTSARHHVQGTASVTVQSVTIGLQGMWKDRYDDESIATDQYGVLHTRLAYNTRLGGQRVTVSGEVRNLFDRAYSEVFDAPMPGRTFLVGASVNL